MPSLSWTTWIKLQVQASVMRAELKQQQSVWYPYYSNRFSHVNVEHYYFIEGPFVCDAAREGVKQIWSTLQSLLKCGSYSLVFLTVTLPQPCFHMYTQA